MNTATKKDFSLIIWILTSIVIGGIIGFFIKPHIDLWYATLQRSSLTPPSYLFSIVWTILYGIIGACGWIIWSKSRCPQLTIIKTLYIIQLISNWSWSPLFFMCHATGIALMLLICIDITACMILFLCYKNIRFVSMLMIPYLLWVLFATYLNFYIWHYN